MNAAKVNRLPSIPDMSCIEKFFRTAAPPATTRVTDAIIYNTNAIFSGDEYSLKLHLNLLRDKIVENHPITDIPICGKNAQ